ncbi:MAG TPA: hypothetical protein EYQ85_00520 [Candidatus Poseidoniales archaeon]|nr:hypothetical protein [Candidatus Poseidoniales archaeon]
MFRGMVEKPSHEKGLLVSFSGAAPALGSRLIDGEGRLIGIVDSVLGKVEEPLLHLKMKLQADPAQMIGLDLEIQSRNKSWDDRKRDSRGGRDDRRSRDDRGGRDDRRGRDDRGGRDDRSSGDWFCRKCSNSNFSFRTECNRCNAPKPGGRDGGRDERRGGRDDRGRQDRSGGDWDCPKCNNSNFSFRTECNRCNAPKGGGGDSGGSRGGERGSSRGERRGERRGPHQERYDRGDRNDSRDHRSDNRGDNDWTCSQCNNSNFAFRTECNRCNASKDGGGGSRGGDRGGSRGSDRGGSRGSDRGGSRGGDRGGSRGSDRGGSRGGDRGSSRGSDRGAPRGSDRGAPRGGDRDSGQSGARRDGRRGPSQRGTSGRIFRPRKPKDEPRHNSNRKNPSNPFDKDD